MGIALKWHHFFWDFRCCQHYNQNIWEEKFLRVLLWTGVSFKFFMQKLLHFIVGMNFMLSFSTCQEVIDVKNAKLPQNWVEKQVYWQWKYSYGFRASNPLSFWWCSFGYLFPSISQITPWKSEGHKEEPCNTCCLYRELQRKRKPLHFVWSGFVVFPLSR